MRKAGLIYFVLLLPLLLFQNCSYSGTLILLDNNLSMVGNGGNGGGYDGKLSFIIKYKGNEFIADNVTMYSGETMSFTVSGGVGPYTYLVNGLGSFVPATQSYTTPFYANSPQFESIQVTDSQGATGVISIQVNSFVGQNKLIYPPKNSPASSNSPGKISLNSKEVAYTTVLYYDAQNNQHSVLRTSGDHGETWNTLREFDFPANIYINRQNDFIYIIDQQAWNFMVSKDGGITFEKVASIGADPNAVANFSLSGLLFISEQKLLAYGGKGNPPTWTSYLSQDGGSSWAISDSVTTGTSGHGGISTAVIDSEGVIYEGGFLQDANRTSGSWFVRKSTDLGLSWTTDQDYRYAPNYVNNHNKVESLVVDSVGNIYASGTIMDTAIHQHWLIFKKAKGSSNWVLIQDYTYLQQASGGVLMVDSNDVIYVTGYGFDPNGANISETGHQLLFKSTDYGATWNKVYDIIPYLVSPGESSIGAFTIFKDGSYLVPATRAETMTSTALIKKSIDGGLTWQTKASYKGTSSFGGDFIAHSLIQYSDSVYFMAGFGKNPGNLPGNMWLVLKTSDAGLNWQVVDRYKGPDNSGTISEAYSMFKDHQGQLFVVGQSRDKNYDTYGTVRKSSDEGLTWQTVDELTSPADSFGKFLNAVNSITENQKGDLFVLGTDYYFKMGMAPNTSIKTRLHRSSDGGKTWVNIDSVHQDMSPGLIKSCFGNVLFGLSYDQVAFKANIARSGDNGLTWQNIDAGIPKASEMNRDIFCGENGEVSLFTNERSWPDWGNNKLIHYRSLDKGLTWTKETVVFKNPGLNGFFVTSFVFDGSNFWLGGSVYSPDVDGKLFYTNWTVVRTSADLKESFIVDQFVDPKAKSSVEKIISCSTGICLIGRNKDTAGGEEFTMFRSIEAK